MLGYQTSPLIMFETLVQLLIYHNGKVQLKYRQIDKSDLISIPFWFEKRASISKKMHRQVSSLLNRVSSSEKYPGHIPDAIPARPSIRKEPELATLSSYVSCVSWSQFDWFTNNWWLINCYFLYPLFPTMMDGQSNQSAGPARKSCTGLPNKRRLSFDARRTPFRR